ncbi:MAG: response regulator transcription factor [Porticoccus sp.]|nr:response regulator transcription factor [Porticoccus sp.]|tara:strand:+ start:116 stop:805 length:690 start_codon:yes stop_codon:yes gene_type:complete
MKAKICVGLLEDDPPQAELVQGWLLDSGYNTYCCTTGQAFIDSMSEKQPDVVVLDWQLPDIEGIDVLKILRQDLCFDGPVIFATGKGSEEDIVLALNAGADDYLVKPLRRSELDARLSALWRRYGHEVKRQFVLGPISIDLDARRTLVDGEEVKLTPIEFDLAVCVLSNVNKLLSRDYLLKEVWGVGVELDTRTVDMHISKIRRLLKINPEMGYGIKTVYRHGYRLEAL